MKNILLSIIGVATLATFTNRAEAHDWCGHSDYGYHRSYQRSTTYVEAPTYYRSYRSDYYEPHREYYVPRYVETRRCESEHHHHGLHGFLERLFR